MAVHIYSLSGLVHPERADVNVSLAEARLSDPPPDMAGALRFSIIKSQISASYSSEVPVASADSLRIWVESAIRGIVDTLGFTNGCGYDVEITQFFDLTSGAHLVFGVQDPVISSLKVFERLDVMDVVKLHGVPASVYLQHCFADLREAIRSPLDSGFFCYRALESLVQYYRQTHQLKTKTDAWAMLRDQTHSTEEDCRRIERAAQPVRHGQPRRYEPTERAEIMHLTWRIVESFVANAVKANAAES